MATVGTEGKVMHSNIYSIYDGFGDFYCISDEFELSVFTMS